MSWAKWTRQNTFFTVPGRVTLIRHACPAPRELIGLAAAQCRGKRKIDLLHANWMRKKRQTDVTRRHFNVFVTTNCDTQPGYKLRSPPWTESHYLDAMQRPFPDWGVIRRQGADRPFSQQPPSPACQSSSQPGKSNVNPSNNPCLNSPNCFLLPPLTAQQPRIDSHQEG